MKETLGLTKGPNRVVARPPIISPEDGNRSSLQNVFLETLDNGQGPKT
jgi:hypothetical protein